MTCALGERAIVYPGILSAQRRTDRLPRIGDARPGAGYRPSESKFGLTATSRVDEPLGGFQFALRPRQVRARPLSRHSGALLLRHLEPLLRSRPEAPTLPGPRRPSC